VEVKFFFCSFFNCKGSSEKNHGQSIHIDKNIEYNISDNLVFCCVYNLQLDIVDMYVNGQVYVLNDYTKSKTIVKIVRSSGECVIND
jgi:hypothetical protein